MLETESDTNQPLAVTNVLTRPDGSVIFTQGESTVVAGIYGPLEVRTNKMLMDKANVEVYFRPKAGLPSVSDRFNEAIIKNIIETSVHTALYPRSAVEVIIQEMQTGDQLLTCSINATCLALLDSGIDMKFLFAAVTCSMDEYGCLSVILNNDYNLKKKSCVFVFDNINYNVIASHTKGLFTVQQLKEALTMCKENTTQLFDYYKTVMKTKYLNK